MKKTFKIFMLPTKQKALIYTDRHGNLKPHSTESTLPLDSIGSNFHLYIISDDEIKEGDWWYNASTGLIWKVTADNVKCYNQPSNMDRTGLNKIVATTDTSLRVPIEILTTIGDAITDISLPQLPESFIQAYIKAYNEGKPITEVDLEKEFTTGSHHPDFKYPDNHPGWKLKTRADNTVIVHQSKMYSRAEVIAFAKKYAARCQAPIQSTKWIDENL